MARLLVIDDEKAILDLVKNGLEKMVILLLYVEVQRMLR